MNINILKDYKERGLLYSQVHPTLPLTIWNYTPETQYSGHWDDITLMCRGLVTDLQGNIIAKGFPKFFNLEEEKHIATDKFEIFEKLDGSLILVFWYNDEMVVASRGSFTSDHANKARQILDEKYPKFKNIPLRGVTYCFELIGFEQIVVSYPNPELVLTGVFDVDGKEYFNQFTSEFNLEVPIVKQYSGLDWKSVKQLNWKNSEGFVVRFSNGSRCKIKFEDYIKLHRQMTNLSTVGIWEALRDGKPISSILGEVPDEFFDKIKEFEYTLCSKYNKISQFHNLLFEALSDQGYTSNRKSLAEQVFFLKEDGLPVNPSIVFAMLDGKQYDKHIWKMVEPVFEKL